jgi:hypothetical protein
MQQQHEVLEESRQPQAAAPGHLQAAAMMMAGRHTAEGRQRQAGRSAEAIQTPAAADTVSA